MFHLVSLSLQISLTDLPGPCLGLCVVLLVLLFWVGFLLFFSLGKFDLNHMLIPVVDRPCLALVRQCRKKKCNFWPECTNYFVRFNSVRPIADYAMLTVGRSVRDLL